jgi:5-methylthioadenosine/S-adenosylhomocysteine deaminase
MTDPVPQACDLIIEAGWVVPVVPHGVVLTDHAVVVSGGAIVAVLPIAEARTRFEAKESVSRPDAALIPGLVNAHTHNPMTLLRGVADDLPLKVWLQEHIWPIEGAVIGPGFVADGVTLAIAEMLRGGTTCCNENYFFPDVQAATYKRHGFRARVGLPVIDFPTAWASSDDEYFDRAGEVHDQWRDDALIRTAFAPHAPYTVNDANFERVRMLADQLDVPVHLHLHETAQEVQQSHRTARPAADRAAGPAGPGQRPPDRRAHDPAHRGRDPPVRRARRQRGALPGIQPQAGLRFLPGLRPGTCGRDPGHRHRWLRFSNNDLDMVGETRTAALLAKAVASDATGLRRHAALRAATLGGAKAIGFDHLVGSLEPGKRADIACVDLSALETQPLHNVVSQLIYATGRHQVSDVWIEGDQKLRRRVLVDMDLDGIIANARQWRDRIATVRPA